MEYNNKILFLAVLIILVGVIAFNFNSISGRATIQTPQISVSPKVIEFTLGPNGYGSEGVTFSFNAPSGVDRDAYLFYDSGDYMKRKGRININLCNRDICTSGSATLYLRGDPKVLEPGYYTLGVTRKDQTFYSDKFFVRYS